jgi:pimeloyl-ACP methyl ester carboxylesterase
MIELILIIAGVYASLSLAATYAVHRFPRRPVDERPDWGHVIDTSIPAPDGGSLEVWRVEPEVPSRGIVVLAHGWGRNRGRMVGRARLFGSLGFTAVLHSARDHGKSTPNRFMNGFRFAEDIESVLNWVDEPVLLYGHSVGAVGAVIAAQRNPGKVKVLFLEGCYSKTRKALVSLYRSHIPVVGGFLAPTIVFWMNLFYRRRLDTVSPSRLAPEIDIPVLIIHGEKDASFPLPFAWELRDAFPAGRAELFVAPGSDHSSSSLTHDYPKAIRSFIERHVPD